MPVVLRWRLTCRLTAVIGLSIAVVTGCSSAPPGSTNGSSKGTASQSFFPPASPTEQPPPPLPTAPSKAAPPAPGFRDDGIGSVVPVHDSSGASASITLNGFRYAPVLGDSMGAQLIVLDVTIEGTAETAYHYSASDFQFAYLGNNETVPVYAHISNRLGWGASTGDDFRPFMPPGPLRVGSVSRGQQVYHETCRPGRRAWMLRRLLKQLICRSVGV
jgi:hypothetical protein